MTTYAATAKDFGYVSSSANAKSRASGLIKSAFNAWTVRRERSAIAQLASFDPRLAGEIQQAQDRAEW